MLFGLLKNRIHEPFALSSIFAASCSLHAAWMINLLFTRIPSIETSLTLLTDVGPISGMYALVLATYLMTFGICVLWFQGKDLSHVRKSVLSFFFASLVSFLVLTHPIVYSFEIQVPNG